MEYLGEEIDVIATFCGGRRNAIIQHKSAQTPVLLIAIEVISAARASADIGPTDRH